MRKSRFNIFTAEEFDDSVVEGESQVSETQVADAIEAENDAVEINNEVTAVEEDCELMDQACEVTDELQEQVDAQEEVLEENPEEVTEDTVVAAQEEFYITMSKLGSLAHYSINGRISQEMTAGTPAEKLRLSCEGVKDFIKAIVEKIKIMFIKVTNIIKKLMIKIKLVFDNTEKKTAAIADELAKLKGGKLKKDVAGQIVGDYALLVNIGAVNKITDVFNIPNFVYGASEATNKIGEMVKTVAPIITGALAKGNIESLDENKELKDADNKMGEFTAELQRKLVGAEDYKKLVAKLNESTPKDEKAVYLPYSFLGISFKVLKIKDTNSTELSTDNFSFTTYSFDKVTNNSSDKLSNVSSSDLTTISKDLKDNSKIYKNTVNKILKIEDVFKSALDTVGKAAELIKVDGKEGKQASKTINNFLKIVRVAGSSLIISVASELIRVNAAVLKTATLLAKTENYEGEKSEDKE